MTNRIIRSLCVFLAAACIAGLAGCRSAQEEIDQKKREAQEEVLEEARQEKEAKKLSVGDEAPDFRADLNNDTVFVLSEHKGEVVLLNFWATWCGPCVGEMPAFEQLYEEYAEEVQIVAVNCAEDKTTVDAFIADNEYTFPIAYDEENAIFSKYPSDGIPYTLVIGKDGKITDIFLGAGDADRQYGLYSQALGTALEE